MDDAENDGCVALALEKDLFSRLRFGEQLEALDVHSASDGLKSQRSY